MTPPAPRPRFRAGRERTVVRGLARMVGLQAAARRTRSALFGTRERRQYTVGLSGSLVVALVTLAIFVPPVRDLVARVERVPGDAVEAIVGGPSESTTVDKQFPRLYSIRLGVDVQVKPGDGRTPPVAPIAFEYPNTAELGKPGNTYLYAHDRPGMFLGLHKAEPGDVFILALDAGHKLYFQVTEIHANVAWNDFQWLRPTTDTRLTLQTCNYSGDFDPRFIVVTKSIPSDQGAKLTGNA